MGPGHRSGRGQDVRGLGRGREEEEEEEEQKRGSHCGFLLAVCSECEMPIKASALDVFGSCSSTVSSWSSSSSWLAGSDGLKEEEELFPILTRECGDAAHMLQTVA